MAMIDESECPQCPPRWLTTFADLMSLLLTFFILLLSMATLEKKKVTEVSSVFQDQLGIMKSKLATNDHIPVKKSDSKQKVKKDINTTYRQKVKKSIIELNELMNKTGGKKSNELSLEDSQNGFVLKLPSAMLFKPGSAVLQNEDAVLVIKRISVLIKSMPADMHIDVQGHTDNVKIKDSPYNDLWALSAARALTIVREFIKSKNDPKKFSASGYANYQPVATNKTEEGRSKNRRVEIHFYGTSTKQENEAKNILDKAAIEK